MTKQMTCTKAFDYLTEGRTYQVEMGKRYWTFRDIERDCGTFIYAWMGQRALASGHLVEA